MTVLVAVTLMLSKDGGMQSVKLDQSMGISPNPGKTVLIVKGAANLELTKDMFKDTRVSYS